VNPKTAAEAPPRRLTRKQRQAQTRERLLEAAERVFIREGVAGSSVEKIAAEAGFTRGAFYSNFESKEQLFVELLHDRIFSVYGEMLERNRTIEGTPRERLRAGIEGVRDVQEHKQGKWLFQLWLELMALAARDEEFRGMAATFWSGNRAMMSYGIAEAFEESGREPPLPPDQIAAAMTALDIGLAVQHLVDPDQVPLDLYVPLYDLLFGRLVAMKGEE
jgi:AcrR family transcriptional regulator